MEKLKLGIIGTGGIARAAHIPALLTMENIEIVALCDIVKEKPLSIKTEYNMDKAGVYENYEDVLNIPEIDAIDICTPNYLHSKIAIAALNKGINVFCEKPDAISPEEALAMEKAAENSGKTLMVMRNNRYAPASVFLKKYIQDGKMGEIYTGRCGWQRRRGIPGKGGWFTTKELSGGGPLIDLGVHMMDLAIWLMENPKPISVTGCTYSKFAQSTTSSDSVNSSFGEACEDGIYDVEDLTIGFIKFENGASLQLEFSWASNIEQENNFVELRGTKAGSTWLNVAGNTLLKIFSEENGVVTDMNPKTVASLDTHGANLKHFVDVVLNGATPDFIPLQGVNMIKILGAIYESAESGKEIYLG